jgi:hypothetical protein
MGVSASLWNLVMGALRAGVRKEMILGMIWAVQHKLPDVPPEISAGPPPQSQPQQEQNHDSEGDKMETDEADEGEVHNEVTKSDEGAAPDPKQSQPPTVCLK